jgi:hypothetical protein
MQNRQTIIKHERSTRGTPLSLSLISSLALDLARLPDGTIDQPSFRNCFDAAFEILTHYDDKLSALQSIQSTSLTFPEAASKRSSNHDTSNERLT